MIHSLNVTFKFDKIQSYIKKLTTLNWNCWTVFAALHVSQKENKLCTDTLLKCIIYK